VGTKTFDIGTDLLIFFLLKNLLSEQAVLMLLYYKILYSQKYLLGGESVAITFFHFVFILGLGPPMPIVKQPSRVDLI
jgi:hypothetical protein